MQPTVEDAVVLVYNYAVVVSGWVLVTRFGFQSRTTLLALSLAVAVAWTVYFRTSMRPRFTDRGEAESVGNGERDA